MLTLMNDKLKGLALRITVELVPIDTTISQEDKDNPLKAIIETKYLGDIVERVNSDGGHLLSPLVEEITEAASKQEDKPDES